MIDVLEYTVSIAIITIPLTIRRITPLLDKIGNFLEVINTKLENIKVIEVKEK